MPAPRRPARRRQPRAARLVTVGASLSQAEVEDGVDGWQFDGWSIGLLTASYLRHYFADFWAAHVAQKPLTTSRLLGAFHAWLILGHHHLLELDLFHHCPLNLELDEAEAPELVDGYRDEGGILYELANDLWRWAGDPPIQVYGLSRDMQHEQWRRGEDRLGLAIAFIHHRTTWSQGLWPMEAHLAALPPGLPDLDAQLTMPALADALTWSCPLDGVDQPWTLGNLLRYAAGATHNHYADYAVDEVAGDGTWWARGVYDDPENLAREIQLQRGARHLSRVYEALAARVQAEPALLSEIGRQVAAAAVSLAPAEEVLCAA